MCTFRAGAIGVPAAAGTTGRLDGFEVEAETLQGPANESPQGELLLDRWMHPRNALDVDDAAVAGDALIQILDAVDRGAGLRQQFDAAAIGDAVLGRDPGPKIHAMSTQWTRRRGAGGGRGFDEGDGRVLSHGWQDT